MIYIAKFGYYIILIKDLQTVVPVSGSPGPMISKFSWSWYDPTGPTWSQADCLWYFDP